MKIAYVISLMLSTKGIILNKLREDLKLLYLRPALYILTQKAVMPYS
jgi:hypothetical protein